MFKRILYLSFILSFTMNVSSKIIYDFNTVEASVSLKIPGNPATIYPLQMERQDGNYRLFSSSGELPVNIIQHIEKLGNELYLKMSISAMEDIYFHYSQRVNTGVRHDDCLFYMPGFWYRRNLRSPQSAPSFHTSTSWTVREDRLSAPLTGIFDDKRGAYYSVLRIDSFDADALTTHREGEVILSGRTSVGYTGFEEIDGESMLSFGFPYQETPKSYIRKLTLAPSVKAFQFLKKGEHVDLEWQIKSGQAKDFSDFVKQMWEYSYDIYSPQQVNTEYSNEEMKEKLSSFFVNSYKDGNLLNYYSGAHLKTALCDKNGIAEIGFIGRVLLNAFNALEYGTDHNKNNLVDNSLNVFKSYLNNGFTPSGFFKELVNFDNIDSNRTLSIRRQSEGVYAIFHYLQFEKERGVLHPEWEEKLKVLLNNFLLLQNKDGSFPRKFDDDFVVIDISGGSTPSVTLPLVMAYKYFKDKRYLNAAKRTAVYLEKELISKADYFSSTLDANCEDKEASLYAATATYYLSLVTKGKESKHYADLARQAAYFALSWYYVWDVPFAKGQMLGDVGLKTRGWGNVSVENNHIDVFVFEFGSVLNWLAAKYDEPRFSYFSKVMASSMKQLIPYKNHLCGIAKEGYYPEVVQHTNWDYGKNGKGYYNDIFAPGWTVASLWELFSPGRAETFLFK